ncbi:hypothetical protein BDC45DRAFT_560737 [Circinella umbellata]|nr:hypothetical protein BDC45DRAFT_560737 [Circinella umbellata]
MVTTRRQQQEQQQQQEILSLTEDNLEIFEAMNDVRRVAVEGAHVEIPPFNVPTLSGGRKKIEIFYGYCQPSNVCRNCQKSHKYCYRLESGDKRCAWCKHRKQHCVMDTLPGVVPTRNLVLPLRMQRYFINERNNWLDSQREFPEAELVGSDDESLSWERGVRANLEEFVPCRLEWLYEHVQEAEYPPLNLHDQNVPFHTSLVVDLSAWESEFRTEIIDGRTCLVITHNNRPSPPSP